MSCFVFVFFESSIKEGSGRRGKKGRARGKKTFCSCGRRKAENKGGDEKEGVGTAAARCGSIIKEWEGQRERRPRRTKKS